MTTTPTKGDIQKALRNAGRPLKSKELARVLGIPKTQYLEFKGILKGLLANGDIYKVKGGRYAPLDQINLVPGTLSVTRTGVGFLTPDKGGEDIFIPAGELNTAFEGDRVVVRLERRGRARGRQPEGRVVKILERARTSFVGTAKVTPKFALVSPDNPKLRKDIFVPADEMGEADDGDKVQVTIVDWGSLTSAPVGRITEVLGRPGDPQLDVRMVIRNHGLEETFPSEVEAWAEKIPPTPPQKEIEARLDLRQDRVITIDPLTAKDFDDALSIKPLNDGVWEVGIHIADVSHYVGFEDPIDQEAYRRATSVYLVDRVLPMLPEKLSNHLCSLNPNEDKLAMSVLVQLDQKGRVLDYSVEDTVIRSHRRFAYEEVQAYFDGDQEAADGFQDTLDPLRSIAGVLHEKREARGALDFDLPASRVLLDDEGFPVDIQKVVRQESHRLVEEFMLLANELVAKKLRQLRRPAMFRVHESPSPSKLDELIQQIGPFGYALYGGDDEDIDSRELQRILQQAEGEPEEYIVHTLVLRSLMRARYDVLPLGHYGLALKDYTHFTSPIRRYPDLVVHRMLRALSGKQKRTHRDASREGDWLDACAVHSSDRERLAEQAERDSVELKKIHFMERHIGDEFEGIISGVEAFGCFVELFDYHVSGLIHVNNLEDDYYQYLEDEFALVGANTGVRFSLGDKVRIQVMSVRRELRQIDFLLLNLEPSQPIRSKRKKSAPKSRTASRKSKGRKQGKKRRR